MMSETVKIGQAVVVDGMHAGVVGYVGLVEGKQGLFCGVSLIAPVGKNDGTHAGKFYFKCEGKNHGIFCRPSSVVPAPSPSLTENVSSADTAGASLVGALPNTPDTAPVSLCLGQSVLVGKHRGTIAFIGSVEGKEGTFVGASLVDAVGRNDGTAAGKRYFECKRHHGLFVRPDKIVVVPRGPTTSLQCDGVDGDFSREAPSPLKKENGITFLVEGYWGHPTSPDSPFPVPLACEEPFKDAQIFLERLELLSKLKTTKITSYRGYSPCRICDNRKNGSREFSVCLFDGKGDFVNDTSYDIQLRSGDTVVSWPEGYSHYISHHNVRPSRAFFALVTSYPLPQLEGSEPTKK